MHAGGLSALQGGQKSTRVTFNRLWEVGGFAECVCGHFFLLYIIYKIKRVDSSVETMV